MVNRGAKSLMLTSRAGKSSSQNGFTLIELAVVVALIATFTVLAVPLFSRFGTSDLGYSARHLNGTIKYFYNESALSGLEYRLVFDLDHNQYRAVRVEADGEIVAAPGLNNDAELAGDATFRDLYIPGRGTFTTGQVSLAISPSGWMEEALIHLQGGANEQLTLKVLPLTGVTEIRDGYQML